MGKLLRPRFTKYMPLVPTPKQQAFLLLECKDAFYGGAARGGKSVALLMAALQYVDMPGYNAILIRDSYTNLSKPGALMPMADEWLSGTDAHWHGELKQWEFPTGGKPATLSFGYLDGPRDHYHHKSSDYQFEGIDEAVSIREEQALYMFTRLTRTKEQEQMGIPLRFRCASNPPARLEVARGAWVKTRYVDSETRRKGAIFIPARLQDNPHEDQYHYEHESLSEVDPITRAQLLEGDWNVKATGHMFKRHWFEVVDAAPMNNVKTVRYWDMASTKDAGAYTCGCKITVTPDGLFFIESMIREQLSPRHCEALVRQTADMDGRDVPIWMEQEPGSSGVAIIDHYRRNILRGFAFRGDKVDKAKTQRAGPFASQAEGGNVFLVNGAWVPNFLDEIELYPDGPFLDQVDSGSGAFNKLVGIGAGVTPRISLVGSSQKAPLVGETPEGECIEVWEGDKLLGYEKITPAPAPVSGEPNWLGFSGELGQ